MRFYSKCAAKCAGFRLGVAFLVVQCVQASVTQKDPSPRQRCTALVNRRDVATSCSGGLSQSELDGNWSRTALVIDAGSSGTRAHLFAYDWRSPLTSINEVCRHKHRPGLGACATDVATTDMAACAQEHVSELLDTLGADASVVAETPIWLRATGGLRLLTAQEKRGCWREPRQ